MKEINKIKEKSCFDLNQLNYLHPNKVIDDFILLDKMLKEIIKLKDKYLIETISYDTNYNIILYSYYGNLSDFLSELKDNFKIVDIEGNYDPINEAVKIRYTLSFWEL